MFKDLVAKYQFWRAKKLEVGKDYDFCFDLSNKDAIAIKLLKKYPGVIIEFVNIHMSSDTNMSYDMTVIANPNLHNTDSRKFKEFTSDIFRSIINKSVENAKEVLNENRELDSVEPNAERVFHEEVITVSEERVPERKPRKKTVRKNKAVYSEVQQPTTDSSDRDSP